MPEGSTLPEEADAVSIPFQIPEDMHDAGIRISQIGKTSRKRQRILSRFEREDVKLKKKRDDLKKETDRQLIELNHSAGHLGNELLGYVRKLWRKLTKNGSTKQIRFWSGEVSFRNLPDRAVVHDDKKFMASARRRGLTDTLIIQVPDKPNVRALNKNIALARSFKSVAIEEKSTVTIKPRHGSGALRAEIPRKMVGTLSIEKLLGDETLQWELVSKDEE